MKPLPILFSALLITSCAAPKTYQFYDGSAKATAEVSTIKPKRSFGGPAVYIKYVNDRYIADYASMSGYPENDQQANILEPRIFQLAPGKHKINTGFGYTDSPNKFATVASLAGTALLTGTGVAQAKLVHYSQFADIEFTTKANKVYQINYLWDEVSGVTFYVNECDQTEQNCSKVEADVQYTKYSIKPGMPNGKELLAR